MIETHGGDDLFQVSRILFDIMPFLHIEGCKEFHFKAYWSADFR